MPTRTLLSRRDLVGSSLAFSAAPFFSLAASSAVAQGTNLLDPAKVQDFPKLSGEKKTIRGFDILYADYGPPKGPSILYFHGWGDGFQAGLPREYVLADAGYRIIMPNRPGYKGTSINFGGTAADTAAMARNLLDALAIDRVHVMGTSGGGPAALAFASQYQSRTKALILQCAVTHRWNTLDGKKYVPKIVQADFDGAPTNEAFIKRLKKRFDAIKSEDDLLEALVGQDRIPGVKSDAAYYAYMASLSAGLDEDNKLGKDNDVARIFLSFVDYFYGPNVPRTLIIHDPEDPLVPFDHASFANVNIPRSSVLTVNGGHFMWLGTESVKLRNERVAFLNAHKA